MSKLVYLAGKMAGLSFEEQSKWRNEAKDILNDNGFRVFNSRNYLTN